MLVPDIRRYLVCLRVTRHISLRFLHGGIVHGLACRALAEHPLAPGVVPVACESGLVTFAPGDPYRFGLTTVGGERLDLVEIERRLRELGAASAGRSGPPQRLGGNFAVDAIEELPPSELPPVPGSPPYAVSLQFTSPLRMERPPGAKERGKKYLDGACFPAAHFVQRVVARLQFLARFAPTRFADVLAGLGADGRGCHAEVEHLQWIDMPVPGRKRPHQPKGYTLGGVLGAVRLEGLDEAAWLALQLGSLVHVGEKTHYGFGRYVVRETADLTVDPFQPSRSVLDIAADRGSLQAALVETAERSETAGVDGVLPEEALAEADTVVEDIRAGLLARRFEPQALLGLVAVKKSGEARALAVPTARDRCAQRAVCRVLGPAIETLLEDCSYAFRKGFSRTHAAAAIRRAYERGYRRVLDADIDSFFDSVTWDRMLVRLRALYPFEPLADLIAGWLAAPVHYRGRVIHRERGLPQGAPVSPLLANLFLDEFDEELLGQNYRLVRYADDFVVLCRDLEEARRAHADARAALGRLGLELNEDKTSIRTFDAGFSYLGYLFCRSLVLEQKETEDDAGGAPTTDERSWLAQVPLASVREVRPGGPGRDAPTIAPLAEVTPAPAQVRRPLHVTGHRTRIHARRGALLIERADQPAQEVPRHEIAHLVLHGMASVTMPALVALARDAIPVLVCRRSGEVDVTLVAPRPDWSLWAHQGALADDPARCLEFARAVVQAKLNNARVIARRFKLQGVGDGARQLGVLERRCLEQTDADGLRGLEGQGAGVFFALLRDTLGEEWRFRARRRHPPTDPVNAMLSFGYTLLYNHVATALAASGLDVRTGFYHRQHGSYAALACDLQEELRYLVDAFVWSLMRRREIRSDDFAASPDGRYPCLLRPAARRAFLRKFERRLGTEFRPPGYHDALTYRAFIDRQAQQVKDLVNGARGAYEPLRIRA